MEMRDETEIRRVFEELGLLRDHEVALDYGLLGILASERGADPGLGQTIPIVRLGNSTTPLTGT